MMEPHNATGCYPATRAEPIRYVCQGKVSRQDQPYQGQLVVLADQNLVKRLEGTSPDRETKSLERPPLPRGQKVTEHAKNGPEQW